jgi:hypothetical protein
MRRASLVELLPNLGPVLTLAARVHGTRRLVDAELLEQQVAGLLEPEAKPITGGKTMVIAVSRAYP